MWRLAIFLVFPLTVSAQLNRFQFLENKMGGPFQIIFYHTDSAEAAEIARACFRIVDSLNDMFSNYSSRSEIARLQHQPTHTDLSVSDELFRMIARSRQAWIKSKKAFDVTIGRLTRLWRMAVKENRFPPDSAVEKARAFSGFKHVRMNEKTRTISFRKPGIQFDFGGIVPGYAAQKVIDHLRTKNILHALADASGDMAMSLPPPGREGWTIAINLPEKETEFWPGKLVLKNGAVASSGDMYRYFLHEGKKYSHIIDPRTGYGLTHQRNVTVIAGDGAAADWLATACSILPVKKALRLARREKAGLLIATPVKGRIVAYKTRGFDLYFSEDQP